MIPEGLGVTDTMYYLGSVSHSLEHLPRWYQILSLCGIFLVLYFRHNELVSWIVVNLHSSFGTSSIWYPDYQKLLESMTFNERFGFTLYGVGLGTLAGFVFAVFCQDRYNLGGQVSQVFPNRRLPTALLTILLCTSEAFSLRHLIYKTLGPEDTPIHLAVVDFEQYKTLYHPSVENVHFVVQSLLLKVFLVRFLRRQIPVFIVATGYRFIVDVSRGQHCALRWYVATVCRVSIVSEAIRLYFGDRNDVVAYSVILWSLAFLGTVNYIYGPAVRAGIVRTMSTTNALQELIKGMITGNTLMLIACLLVLMVVVSVHVVELIAVWLITSLLLVWTPAIVDSCSIEYIFFISCTYGYCGYSMEFLDGFGATVAFVLLFSAIWINFAIVYNTAVNLSKSRYVGLGICVWISLSILSTTDEEKQRLRIWDEIGFLESIAEVITLRLGTLAQLANGKPLPPHSYFSLGCATYGGAMKQMGGLTLFLTLVNLAIGRFQSAQTKEELHSLNIPLITPNILFRKCIHTFVLTVLVGLSFCVGFVVWRYHIFPRMTILKDILRLPDVFFNLASFCIFCTTLGVMMDIRKTLYDGCLRVFAMAENRVEDDETEPEPVETYKTPYRSSQRRTSQARSS
ncbi:hypothetical protein AGDE_10741 [Angomonas deanei]|uniref:Uncharacterized protein n=1 Tax=Angomonas deanei TaxID=59799 RepID=A0A7G2C5K4_9TRYP|nr:hypothetical protein AGDE_10741 [Angomonas deanei]CAD2214879.1 hypothetical protein, conserved [Angomonas deanei]|eukprot:EPY27488.1 hypothetical protein AGDE_10741 [Angomonas deanei]